LTPTLAVELAKKMEPYQMFFVEDILPPEQIEWFRHIRQACTTPMAMGELFTHPLEDTPLISQRLIDCIGCRVSQIGGITQAKKIANLCEMFGVRTAWQEGGENDPVNQICAYHVDISSPAFGISGGESLSSERARDDAGYRADPPRVPVRQRPAGSG